MPLKLKLPFLHAGNTHTQPKQTAFETGVFTRFNAVRDNLETEMKELSERARSAKIGQQHFMIFITPKGPDSDGTEFYITDQPQALLQHMQKDNIRLAGWYNFVSPIKNQWPGTNIQSATELADLHNPEGKRPSRNHGKLQLVVSNP